jgi:hypothetical protein
MFMTIKRNCVEMRMRAACVKKDAASGSLPDKKTMQGDDDIANGFDKHD